MKKIALFLTNKYLIASVFFVVWMLFFDQRDYFQQKDRQAELAKLEAKGKRGNAIFMNVEASITSRPCCAARGYEVLTPQSVTARGQDFLNYRMSKRL